MESKKGFIIGFDWIIIFFLVVLLFILLIGVSDIMKVELFTSLSDEIRNLTTTYTNDSNSVYVLKQNKIHEKVENISLPYNLILMFLTAYFILISIWDGIKQEKQDFTKLLFNSIGGIIFMIYIGHLFLIGMLNWFNIEIIGYLFQDLILNEVPFYFLLLDNYWFIFVWALTISGLNRIFGKEKEEDFI